MTERRTALYIATACLAYAATLVATLPAPWISEAVGRLSKQALLLRGPDGSAWAGSGRLYLRQRSGGLLDLGMLRWNASLSGALAGKLVTDLSLGDVTKTAHLELSPGSTALRGVSLELPGEILAHIAPGLNALGPRGTLLIRSENLRIDANEILGRAEVEWRPARLAVVRGLDLGSHVARLRGGGSKIDIELGTIEGPLRLSGGGAWTRDNGLAVSGTIEHGDSPPAIAPFLQGVCSEYRSGRCTFRFKHFSHMS